jgi:GT2 family glycosyltransferase
MSTQDERSVSSGASTPLVSVVIPAHNAAAFLPATLASVMGQSYRPMEVILIDDGSTDDTPVVARACPGLLYLRTDTPRGPSHARNRGVGRAQGPYIAFLDADDLWPPDKLTQQVDFMEAHPEVGMLFGNARRFSSDGWTEVSLFDRFRLTPMRFGHPFLVRDAPMLFLETNPAPTGTVIVRKSALLAAGTFDESLHVCEDWDLWIRVAAHTTIAFSQEVWKLKRVHDRNLSGDTVRLKEAALSILEKLARRPPFGPTPLPTPAPVDLSQRLRTGYCNLGYLHLRALRLVPARLALRRSLALGVTRRALMYLALTFLGPRLTGALLKLRG